MPKILDSILFVLENNPLSIILLIDIMHISGIMMCYGSLQEFIKIHNIYYTSVTDILPVLALCIVTLFLFVVVVFRSIIQN